MSPSASQGSLSAAVEPLLERIEAEGPEVDRAGRLGAEMAGELASAGVFRSTVPESIGGLEAALPDVLEVIESVGRAHGSTGWCVMIGATTALLSGYLPKSEAGLIYGSDPLVITGGAYAPTGKAVLGDDGDLTVTGRWEWGSGSANCSWLLGGAMLVDPTGEPVTDDLGLPHMRMCFAPTQQVQIVDNWDVLGMRGTGSNDLVMDAVAVPFSHSVSFFDDPWPDGPLWKVPPFALLALGIGAVSLGVARSAMDAFIDLGNRKKPTMGGRNLAKRSTIRGEAGRCEAQLRAARALFRSEVESAWGAAKAGADFDIGQRASLRLAATHAATVAADVCTRMHRLGGGTSVRHGQLLERTVRDALTATQHVMVGPQLFESVGSVLFGDEPGFAEL
ncbi:MAG: hydrolase [Actinomycetia bacterium]|nr:hydrolase [Actinomycetes bacterium]